MRPRIRYSESDVRRIPLGTTGYEVLPAFVAMIEPSVLDTPNTVEISARFRLDGEQWEVWSLGVVREEGEPAITPDSLRTIAPSEVLRHALTGRPDVVVNAEGDPVWGVWQEDEPLLRRRRADGPTPENLATLADIYRVARVLHLPPVAKVADIFGLAQRSATHWVKLARERGHLDKEA